MNISLRILFEALKLAFDTGSFSPSEINHAHMLYFVGLGLYGKAWFVLG